MRPVLLVILAASLFGLIGFFIRNITDISGSEIVLFRVTIGAVATFCFAALTKNKISKIKSKWFLINGFFYTGAILLYVNSIYLGTPLSSAAFLFYTAPIFSIIFSHFMIKESIKRSTLLIIVMAFVAALFILKPFNLSLSIGSLLALGSGIFYGLNLVATRKLETKFDTYSVVFYSFFISLLFLIPINAINFTIPSATSVMYIILLGIISTAVPVFLFTESMKKLKAYEASSVALLEPVVASLVGFFIFSEFLGITSIVGAVLILMSSLLIDKSVKAV